MARTGENIYKRKDGRWEARYISSYNADGKAKYKYLYARTYAEVKTKLIRVQNSVETKVEAEKIRDREKYEFWLFEWLRSKRIGIKDSTYIRYRNVIENHINPDLGKYPINKISTPLMERFVSNKLNNGRLDGNGGLSPKTMSDMLTIIKESFKYAHTAGAVTICRFDGISLKRNSQEMRVLSVFEQQQLISVLFEDFDRYKLGVFICLYTGIRIGELCALQWKNISFSEKAIVIEHTMQRLQNDDPNAIYKTRMDDTTTDEVAEDATSVLDSGDSTETAEDTQDEPMDDTAADETTEDATSDLDSGDSTETAEDTQDEPMDDTSNKNSADTVETADNINDTTDINEVNNLSDKVSYLDRMRGDAENALAYDPERKGDWDVVRGRLSDEYRKTSDNLKTLAEGKQAEYEQLRNEYFDALEGADSPEKAARLAELTKRGGELSKEIDTANSRSRYADNFANELSRDLDPSKRTTYEGVGGKSFTDLHQSMIQKQGNAVKDFKGTCGDCSAANTMTALGDTKSEAEVVQRARDLNACVDKKIPSFLPESLKEKMRGSNGGTSVAGRSQILDSFGYDCDNRTNQSLAEISQQIENGKGAIINVDHRVLNKQRDVTAMNPVGTDHALTITGIEKDAAGNAIGLWIHDTGVCSNMGNAFYCNAQDYAVWKSTPNCTVQYVSKK